MVSRSMPSARVKSTTLNGSFPGLKNGASCGYLFRALRTAPATRCACLGLAVTTARERSGCR